MAQHFAKYGLLWPLAQHPLALEMEMIKRGGLWKNKFGVMVGNGLPFHYRKAIELLWPHVKWHRWLELIVENYLTHRSLVIMGPSSTGKTLGAAVCVLLDYYCFPSITTVLVCTTTIPMLEQKIWGEIKALHRAAKEANSWLPGNMIEGIRRIVTDNRDLASQGRDFRNGIVGIPVKKGDEFVGLGDFAGAKNKRLRLVGDELSLLPRVFVNSISNLDKNPDFKVIGLGNPKETTDALGVLGEPAAHLGGWDGGIDQGPKTKVWETRRPDGICIQLVGSESPNLDGKLGIPLITQEQIDRDVTFYGLDSLQYTMMNEGRMPRGQGSRRVLTRQMCVRFHAFDHPVWLTTQRIKIAFLDAAYSGVGGDRCIFGTLEFGQEGTPPDQLAGQVLDALLTQDKTLRKNREILALTSIVIVPINPQGKVEPPDQIVEFVKAQCEKEGIPPGNFFYDAGMRTSLVTAFARLWSNQVNSIDCGGKPTERRVSADLDVLCRDHYSKFITELWFSVRLTVESGQFRGMTDEVAYEFGAREWTMVGNNRTEVEPKEKMKLKVGRSPDLADALAIGVEGARQKGFEIKQLLSATAAKIDDRWKRELQEKADAQWRAHELNPTA